MSNTNVPCIPSKWSLTITSRCNLRCPTCLYLVGKGEFLSRPNDMELSTYSEIIKRYGTKIDRLTLTGGEPTLHPCLAEFVELALAQEINVGLPTNGILVEQKLEIFQRISNHVQISLDATDEVEYAKTRGGSPNQWASILRGIDLLHDNNVGFNLSFLLNKDNIQTLPKILDFCRALDPRSVNLHSYNPHSLDDRIILRCDDNVVEQYILFVMTRVNYPYSIRLPICFMLGSEYHQKKVCEYPWNGIFADGQGSLAYCCHLMHNKSNGSVFDADFFNGKSIKKWRSMLTSGTLPPDCVYCHRRFAGDEIVFNPEKSEWMIGGYSVGVEKSNGTDGGTQRLALYEDKQLVARFKSLCELVEYVNKRKLEAYYA